MTNSLTAQQASKFLELIKNLASSADKVSEFFDECDVPDSFFTGFPFGMSFDDQATAIRGWAETIEDIQKKGSNGNMIFVTPDSVSTLDELIQANNELEDDEIVAICKLEVGKSLEFGMGNKLTRIQ